MSMKKTIILITLCLVALCCPAQVQHLKFMDIPLNGTITQFQQKLTAKGVKYDKTFSAQLPSGARAFSGDFAGEKADIFIYYDPKSKIVYKAKAVIDYVTEDICENKYNEFKALLSSKYGAFEQSGYDYGHETNTYVIAKENASSIDDIIGYICIYVTEPAIPYPYVRELHFEYVDHHNSQKADDSKMKDL